MATKTSASQQLRDNYRQLTDRIAEAAVRAGRKPDNVLMVAVTKNASPDQIRQVVEMGHIDLGENRVQQLAQRVTALEEFLSRRRTLGAAATGTARQAAANLPTNVRWHMIGHLQRNKVKQVAPLVQLIHGVDSLRLAEEIHTYAVKQDITIDVLLQVNASGEASKHGIAPPAIVPLAEQLDTMVHLRLRGLMTMAAPSENPEDARPAFARTAELFEDVRKAKIAEGDFTVLSMGMSNDYEVAISEGANVVRIGTALFGNEEQG